MSRHAKLYIPTLVILSLFSAYLTWQYRSSDSFLESHIENLPASICKDEEKPTKRIAIIALKVIGAGSGGASTAYYLDRFRPPCQPVNITVYERSNYVGGRSTTVNAFNDPSEPVELGASIFVQVNRNLLSSAQELGLTIKRSTSSSQTLPLKIGVWNGQNFVFVQDESNYYWWNTAKILWQYGLAPFRAQNLMKKTIDDFLKMYKKPHFPFRSLSDIALNLGLTSVTSVTGEEFLRRNAINPPFSTEIVQASTRVNYAQNLAQIHGLETMVCMAAEGAMAIEGGNWRIFDGMIAHSGANLALNTTVHEVFRQTDGLFEIRSSKSDIVQEDADNTFTELFDTVVLASPLDLSTITITPKLKQEPDKVAYVRLYVTLFTSPHRIASQLFKSATVPDIILTTIVHDDSGHVSDPGFFSISTLRRIEDPPSGVRGPQYLYKVFSPQRLNATFLSQLLGFPHIGHRLSNIPIQDISWIHEKVWNSYPYLQPRATFAELELAPNLWYTSGIESFISTMETSSLMGKNIAKLVADDWESTLAKNDSLEL